MKIFGTCSIPLNKVFSFPVSFANPLIRAAYHLDFIDTDTYTDILITILIPILLQLNVNIF